MISKCSREWVGSREMICAGSGPRCVIRNMYSEYPAVIRVPAPVRAKVHQDQLKREVMIINSPIRLGRGGRARLARLEMNHHVAIKGRTI